MIRIIYNVKVLWVSRYDYLENWILETHSHNYYQLIYIIDGECNFNLDNYICNIGKGTLIFIKPDCIHGLTVNGKDTLKTLDIKFLVKDKRLNYNLKNVDSITSENISNIIKILIENIKKEGLEKKIFYEQFSAVYLMQIIFTLLRNHEEKLESGTESRNTKTLILARHDDNLCNEFIEYVDKYYSKNLDLDKIALSMGYNKSYICQKIKKELNCTAMQYISKFRIVKSKELIIYSDYSFKQIASMVGFKTVHHFTRIFHKLEGCTPGEWREREKEGIRKNIYLSKNFKNENKIRKML